MGETLEEVEQLIREVITSYLEDMQLKGLLSLNLQPTVPMWRRQTVDANDFQSHPAHSAHPGPAARAGQH